MGAHRFSLAGPGMGIEEVSGQEQALEVWPQPPHHPQYLGTVTLRHRMTQHQQAWCMPFEQGVQLREVFAAGNGCSGSLQDLATTEEQAPVPPEMQNERLSAVLPDQPFWKNVSCESSIRSCGLHNLFSPLLRHICYTSGRAEDGFTSCGLDRKLADGVPYFDGKVPAGFPSPAEDYLETPLNTSSRTRPRPS